MITRLRILRDVRMPSLSRSAGVPADSDVARSSVGPWSISANVVDDPCVDDASAPSAHDTGLDEADIESDAAAVPDPDVETASDVGSSDIGQEEAVERVNSAVTPALRYRRLADLRYRRRLVTQNPTAGTELVDLSEGGAPEGDAPEADVPDGDAARAGTAEVSVDSHSVELAPANAANATSAPEGREQAAPPLGAGRIRRVPALDGLRGIAVLVVVLYHFFGAAVPGGYLGVDIFFVLSGFLITSLLVREYGASERISLSRFWTRRARRILPAALAVLVVSVAVAGVLGGDIAVQLVPQFVGSAFFVNNWVQISQSHSYFADTTPQIFMHYWSLAIEEQFYVVWPLLFVAIMAAARALPMRRRLWVAAGVATVLAVGSVVAMWLLHDPHADPSRVYFGTDTHAFGLLVGVILALLVTAPSPAAPDSWPRLVPERVVDLLGATLAPVGFLALVVLFLVLPDTSSFTYQGGLLLACILAAGIVLDAIRGRGRVHRLMCRQPLRYLGTRSFSIYLWHWPVVVVLRQLFHADRAHSGTLPVWVIGLIAAVLTLALSEASFRWIETPFHRLGLRGVLNLLGSLQRTAAPALALAAALAVALFAGSALGTSPAKSQLEEQLDQLAQMQKANAAALRHAPPPPPAAPVPTLPLGGEITGIGDSVMLASSMALTNRFPGMYIDAEVSRHYTGGEPIIENLAAARQLRKFVVLGFGTNGQAFDGQLDRILGEIGPGHQIVLLVPYGPVDGIPQAARQVLQYAPRHPNVYLAPWCQAAASHQQLLGADGVHPFGPGTFLYADAVTQGLRQAVTGKRDLSISCPI